VVEFIVKSWWQHISDDPHSDMSFAPDVFPRVLKCYTSPVEEIKSAAAFAAGAFIVKSPSCYTCQLINVESQGNIAVGNVPEYLPNIVEQVSGASSSGMRLLYLHSLKEASHSPTLTLRKPPIFLTSTPSTGYPTLLACSARGSCRHPLVTPPQ
jgi:hypothetical protein